MHWQRYQKNVARSVGFRKMSPPTQEAILTVLVVAAAIQKTSTKGAAKADEGHRSIVTAADKKAQKIIFSRLLKRFPNAMIMGEEKSKRRAAISHRNPAEILRKGLRFIVDPVDGTTLFAHRLSNWSIGIGIIEDGVVIGGVIFAPTVNGGLLLFAELEKGAFFKEGDSSVRRIKRRRQKVRMDESVVQFGVDFPFCRNILKIQTKVAANVQGLYTTGSSLLALAHVALGRVNLVVQPPQKPWDYTQARAILKEAGKTVIWFRPEKGKVVRVRKPDLRAFTYPREKNGVGFFAGDAALVRRGWKTFPKGTWRMISPDTVSGKW